MEAELKEKIRQGDHAQRIMNDPTVQKALASMRDTIYHNIRTSHHSKVDEREFLYLQLKAVDHFERQFTDAINGGKKAKKRLTDFFKKD